MPTRRPAKRLPTLPRTIELPAGPIAVLRQPDLIKKHGAAGIFRWAERHIVIDSSLGPTAAWLTLEHERVHAILMDAGVVGLPDEYEERVCDALAAASVARMRSF